MPSVRIGSDKEHLTLVEGEPMIGPPQQAVAELHVDGLTATRMVAHHYTSGFQNLAEFFSRLAHDWRGWADTRMWESLEGELTLEARHQYQHVQLRVTLRRYGPGWGNEGWTATADLTIEPGEQLTQIANDVRRFAVG